MGNINFIYIGPDKSGSTWLYEILKQHPDVFVPSAKDIYFFDKYYDKGLDWYLSFFNGSENYKAVGEISHDYIFSNIAAKRIREVFGKNIKLLTILRNPVDKTWSLYLFAIRNGIINPNTSFFQAIKYHPGIIDRSLYGKHLEIYFELFDRNQIKIFLFDDLQKNPIEFAKNIFREIGVNFIEDINYKEKRLPASRPRSILLSKLAKYNANLLREMGFINLLGKIKTNKYILKLLYKPYSDKPSVPIEVREFLVEKYFKSDLKVLSKLTKRNFEKWLKI
jgi:hypothetical protein